MSKYILMERNYEYNDEGYSSGENDAGKPKRVFNTLAEATAEATRQALLMLANGGAYMLNGQYIDDVQYFKECFSDIKIYENGNYGYIQETIHIPNPTEGELDALRELVDFNPFYVVEVQD